MGIEFIECYTPPEDVVTCSVKLDFSELADYSYDGVIFHVAYTQLSNNGIRFDNRTRFNNFPTEMILENVVMGSVIYLSSKIPIAPRYDVDTSDFTPIWYERGAFCLVPEAEDLTIQFYYDVNEAVDAKPDQVVEGVKFVGANGVVEEGELPIYDGTDMDAGVYASNDEYVYIQSSVEKTSIIEDVVYSKVPLSHFGNATAADVRKGKRFTSADGVNEEGTIRNVGFAGYQRTVHLDEDDPTGNTFWVQVSQNYTEGYVERAGRFVADVYPKLEIDGNKVTMECLGAKIERTISDGVIKAIASFDESTGKFTASAGVQTDGYVDSNDAANDTYDVGIASLFNSTGWYASGGWIIVEPHVSKGYSKGIYDYWSCDAKTLDKNLVASNIKKDATIFGVIGTYEGASINTCTVNVTFTKNTGNTLISATTFANGAISVFNSRSHSGTVTIANVVCGSAVSINTAAMCTIYWSGSKEDHYSLQGGTITVPTGPGTYTVEVGEVDD